MPEGIECRLCQFEDNGMECKNGVVRPKGFRLGREHNGIVSVTKFYCAHFVMNYEIQTISLDFDGVLHWYRGEWKGVDVIEDEPVPGAVEFVNSLLSHFRVVVFSSRSKYPEGIMAMKKWMKEQGFPEVEFTSEKPAAHLTIDDRAFTFRGKFPSIKEIKDFTAWNKSDASKL